MGWREETRLADLSHETELEVVCRTCRKHRYEWPEDLMKIPALGQLHIDELEKSLRCFDKRCKGAIRIAIMHDHLEEGFVGGMP